MTTNSFEAKVIQEIIKKLKTVSDITKYVGAGSSARIYPGYISTVQDVKYPAISLFLMSAEGQAVDEAGIETVDVQVDLWFQSGNDANANTWDDVMECFAATLLELHNNGGWDTTVGVKVLMMDNLSKGPQLFESDTKIMHYPARFRVRGTLA